MTREYGERSGTCGCGCGATIRERVYRNERGRVIVRRLPTYLAGHNPHPRDNPGPTVPAEPVRRAIIRYRARHDLTWAEMDMILGYQYRGDKGTTYALAHCNQGRQRMRRGTAERILRRLAGLPTAPTRAELARAERQDECDEPEPDGAAA